jgi:hypothetical protein
MIDTALLAELRDTLKRTADWEYFFEHLRSPEWAEPLFEAGLFGDPPALVHEGGYVQVPGWPPSAYLARVSPSDPRTVAALVARMPETDNVRVQNDLLKALIPADPASIEPLVPRLATWLHGPLAAHLLPHAATDLIVAIAQKGATGLATRLFLLWLAEPAEQMTDGAGPGAVEEWWYGDTLDRVVPVLREADALGTLEVLVALLAAVQAHQLGRGPADDAADRSTVWRRAIEDNEQNDLPSNQSALLVHVRDTAHAVAELGCDQLEAALQVLATGAWQVFDRLAVHLAREHGAQCPGVARRFLLRRDLFDNPEMFHEYALLARERFGDLTEGEQRCVVEWIREGPDTTGLREALAEAGHGVLPAGSDIDGYVAEWKARRYELIEQWLPPDLAIERERSIREAGPMPHPEFLRWSTGLMTGPRSPLTQEQVLAMPMDELLGFLRDWAPESGFMLPTREGLSRVIVSAIRARPASFLRNATDFKGHRPTYVRAVFDGARQVLGAPGSYRPGLAEWQALIELARWVVDQPVGDSASDSFEEDVSWENSRKVIAHLLDEAIDTTAVPEELADTLWAVTEPLMADPQPTPEFEARFGPPNMDLDALAINSVRGMAMHAAFHYVVWRAEVGTSGTATVRAALDAIAQHLGPGPDPSLAVRSVFGWWFPAMAEHYPAWASAHAGDVFPLDTEQYRFFKAAWGAYLVHWAPGARELEALRPQYELALSRMGEADGDKRRAGSPSTTAQLLGQHFAWLYCGGALLLDDPLLTTFFEGAPHEVVAGATEHLGRLFLRSAPPPDIWQRLRAWWELRKQVLASATDKSELGKLGWWAQVADIEAQWFLAELEDCLRQGVKMEGDFYLVKKLAMIAPGAPGEALTCLRLMEESGNYSWLISGHVDETTTILRSAMESRDDDLARRARVFIGILTAKGTADFGFLLTTRND